MRTGSAPRASLALRYRRALFVALASSICGVMACSTYGDDLLVSSQGAANAGNAGATGLGGSGNTSANGGTSAGTVNHGGGAGRSSAGADGGAGKSGNSGNAAGESGAAGEGGNGESGNGESGGSRGGAGPGGTSGNGGTTPIGGTSGGVTSTGGSTTSGGSGGAATGIELIDDFEDGDGFIILTKKRNGPWYAFDDGTGGAAAVFKVAAETGGDALSGSTIGGHMTGSGFTGFGAGFGFDFVNQQTKKMPYDVTAYKGVRFYAKVESGSQASIKVLLPTTYSDPMGGKCDDSVATKKCNDHLFVQKTLTTAWAQYQFEFTDLLQQGFGLPQPTLDPLSVYSLQFTAPTVVLPANIWIDNVSFLLAK